jgi:hypothetical protein
MLAAVTKPPPPSRQDTIEAILRASERSFLPIRVAFVQHRSETAGGPAPLAALVKRGRDSTFEQYLLLHAWASGGDFSVRRDSRVWARGLGLPEDDAGRRTVGRNWRILGDLNLVTTKRIGREVRATRLSEDGSGDAYQHPSATKDTYLKLPYEYWRFGVHARLDVPGKAVLLIALTLGDWFPLPSRKGPEWYGISRSTLERGFASARREKVLEMRWGYKEAALAPEGHTRENYYRLLPPLGPRGRLARGAHPDLKRLAQEEKKARRRSSSTARKGSKRVARTKLRGEKKR